MILLVSPLQARRRGRFAPPLPERTVQLTYHHVMTALTHTPKGQRCPIAVATGGICGYDVVSVDGQSYRLSRNGVAIARTFDRVRTATTVEDRQRALQDIRKHLPAVITLTPLSDELVEKIVRSA